MDISLTVMFNMETKKEYDFNLMDFIIDKIEEEMQENEELIEVWNMEIIEH